VAVSNVKFEYIPSGGSLPGTFAQANMLSVLRKCLLITRLYLKISENLLKFQYGNNNNNYIIVSAHNIASDPVLYIIITRDCFYQTIISLHMPAMNLINISKLY